MRIRDDDGVWPVRLERTPSARTHCPVDLTAEDLYRARYDVDRDLGLLAELHQLLEAPARDRLHGQGDHVDLISRRQIRYLIAVAGDGDAMYAHANHPGVVVHEANGTILPLRVVKELSGHELAGVACSHNQDPLAATPLSDTRELHPIQVRPQLGAGHGEEDEDSPDEVHAQGEVPAREGDLEEVHGCNDYCD